MVSKGTLIVVGIGYVGLPVAAKFAQVGFKVFGVDISESRVSMINKGVSPIEGNEPGLQELITETVKSGAFRATTDYGVIKQANYVLIVVQTPFDEKSNKPYYEALRSATTSVGKQLRRGTLVIVESTVAPGTLTNIVQPLLESNSGLKAPRDFMLATAPERVMPGKLLYNLVNLDRVIGGLDEASTKAAMELYRQVVKGQLFGTDALTAEVVKTTENAYRDVQIAFANELALLCENMGIDVYKIRELVNRSPYRDMHLPGAGVGGHCLPKDSWLLAFGAKGKYEPRLITVARAINDGMPLHMTDLCEEALRQAGRRVYGSVVTVLGAAYLENSDDTRNSPALRLIRELDILGVTIVVHDPYVRELDGIEPLKDLEKALKGSDCIALVTAHDEYKKLDLDWVKGLMRTPIIVDGRHVFNREQSVQKGFIFRGVGERPG